MRKLRCLCCGGRNRVLLLPGYRGHGWRSFRTASSGLRFQPLRHWLQVLITHWILLLHTWAWGSWMTTFQNSIFWTVLSTTTSLTPGNCHPLSPATTWPWGSWMTTFQNSIFWTALSTTSSLTPGTYKPLSPATTWPRGSWMTTFQSSIFWTALSTTTSWKFGHKITFYFEKWKY